MFGEPCGLSDGDSSAIGVFGIEVFDELPRDAVIAVAIDVARGAEGSHVAAIGVEESFGHYGMVSLVERGGVAGGGDEDE